MRCAHSAPSAAPSVFHASSHRNFSGNLTCPLCCQKCLRPFHSTSNFFVYVLAKMFTLWNESPRRRHACASVVSIPLSFQPHPGTVDSSCMTVVDFFPLYVISDMPRQIYTLIESLRECRDLPKNQYLNGRQLPTKALAGKVGSEVRWIAFAFETVSSAPVYSPLTFLH